MYVLKSMSHLKMYQYQLNFAPMEGASVHIHSTGVEDI